MVFIFVFFLLLLLSRCWSRSLPIRTCRGHQGTRLLQVAPLTTTYVADAKKRASEHFSYLSLAALWYNPVICDVIFRFGCCSGHNALIYSINLKYASLLQRRSSAAHKSSGVELEDMLQEEQQSVRIMFGKIIVTVITTKKNKALEIRQLQLPFKLLIILMILILIIYYEHITCLNYCYFVSTFFSDKFNFKRVTVS